jgi:hypothetical protein
VVGADRLLQDVGETPQQQEFAADIGVIEAKHSAFGFAEILTLLDAAPHESLELPTATQVNRDTPDIVKQARYKAAFDVLILTVGREQPRTHRTRQTASPIGLHVGVALLSAGGLVAVWESSRLVDFSDPQLDMGLCGIGRNPARGVGFVFRSETPER